MEKKKRRIGKIILIIAVVLIALLVVIGLLGAVVSRLSLGTGTSSSYSEASYDSYPTSNTYDDYSVSGAYEEDVDWDTSESTGSSDQAVGDTDGIIDGVNKLVYSCSVEMQTLTYEESKTAILTKVEELGGVIESETESDSNYSWYRDTESASTSAHMNWYAVLRIPTEEYSAFVDGLSEYGKVMRKSSSVDNISKSYHSTQARIEALETQLDRLQEMMNEAGTIEEMILIEERLSEVEAQLNEYNSLLSSMDTNVAYSTITLELTEVSDYTETPYERPSFIKRIGQTFVDSWYFFLELVELVLNIVIYLLPIAVVVVVIVVIVRRVIKRRKAKRAENTEEEQKKE